MSFRPYHRFQNRARLERLINRLNESGLVPDDIYENFHRYHPSMVHKLKSGKYNLDRLEEKLTTTDIQDAADMAGDFMFEVNMFIDGFFYNVGSALDILARVVLTVFGLPVTGRIFFETAHAQLSQARPGDQILPRLTRPKWRQQFSDYRNTLTHELILASRYQIDIDNTGAEPTYRIIFPLPDDPRARPINRSYRQYPNVLEYVTRHFTRILSIANTVYGDIASRAENNRQFPI
jgi:hypothetical protein